MIPLSHPGDMWPLDEVEQAAKLARKRVSKMNAAKRQKLLKRAKTIAARGKRAAPLPWRVVKHGGPGMSAIMAADDTLVAGSLLCRVDARTIANHKLIVTAVNHMNYE